MKSNQFLRALLLIFLVIPMLYSFIKPNNEIESKVREFIGDQSYDMICERNPDLIKYYIFYVENSYFITNVDDEKIKTLNNFLTLDIPLNPEGEFAHQSFNILKLDVKRDFYSRSYYLIKGTNKLLVFYSEEEFMEKFNTVKFMINI